MFSVIFSFMIIGCNQGTQDNTTNRNELHYTGGLNALELGKYEVAAAQFLNLNHKDSEVLYKYCKGQVAIGNADYETAISCRDSIPADYNGEISKKVLDFRKKSNDEITKEIEKTPRYKMLTQEIDKGFSLIENKQYEQASQHFLFISDRNSSNLKQLFDIAMGLKCLNKKDYRMARYYAEPINYVGYGSEKVNAYKEFILKQATTEKIQDQGYGEPSVTTTQKEVCIGMADYEVLESSWGKPKEIRKTIKPNVVYEHWYYDNGRRLLLEDHYVVEIRE